MLLMGNHTRNVKFLNLIKDREKNDFGPANYPEEHLGNGIAYIKVKLNWS